MCAVRKREVCLDLGLFGEIIGQRHESEKKDESFEIASLECSN